MKIGYARVSTADQNHDLQRQALTSAGCARIYTDTATGGHARRKGLQDALDALAPGDVLTVWRLDRLGRSLPDLIAIVQDLQAKGCGFQSLCEAIDTTTAGGKLVFHVMGALAEFERALIVERTRAGLDAAKQRGARLGRRPGLTPQQVDHARQLIAAGEPPGQVARSLKVGRSTLYRHLADAAASPDVTNEGRGARHGGSAG